MRLASVPIVAALVLALGAASSFGAQVITTTTTVAVTGVAADGSTVTFTASVTAVDPLLARGGPVTFTDTTTGATLGTAPLVPAVCPNSATQIPQKTCTATLTVSTTTAPLVSPGDTITASYPGNALFKPSGGSTQLGTFTACATSGSCTASGTSGDGTAFLRVTQDNGTGNPQGIVISFTTTPLSCTTPGTGDTGVWSVTDLADGKTIQYDALGAAADAAQAAHPIAFRGDTVGAFVCFDGPAQFTTWSGAPATLQPDGTFAGRLPPCTRDTAAAAAAAGPVFSGPPCVENADFFAGEGGDVYSTTVLAPAGEPSMSH
jgi:hypothetical protein